jgi:hypothetical protein
MSNTSVYWKSWPRELRHGNLRSPAVHDRLADCAQGLGEQARPNAGAARSLPRMHFGHAPVVPRDEAVQDLGEEAPLLQPEAPHDAEIDGDDAALIVDEQIAGMHVAVEEAVAHGVAQEGLHQSATDRLQIVDLARAKPRDRRSACRPSIQASARGRALRLQSTCGTAKPTSFFEFSAISEMAAASMRRSISMATGLPPEVSTTASGRNRREGGWKALDHARGPKK